MNAEGHVVAPGFIDPHVNGIEMLIRPPTTPRWLMVRYLSSGIPYVVVNGTIVVKDSKVLKAVFPGKAIRLPVTD